ncbi:polyprenyl synthetase family protein [Arsenicicoccus piscis]|uniref:Geranylgeranyl pyrophosphate synthase n=1 Tax=Arsenicicoccus piscis TaxID=673954 RepID=A0ABQ6HMZ2_9MICO|nr:polyprenyl synthetase family protein [Arsenicicoccus piscis]MCH8628628.1 polyprenyl synthetase family protein [Arsenicicoccus piscis]GMA19443.1 geranylgeranyl pyrophosphate synthase [Arsenicicoccus piscis]
MSDGALQREVREVTDLATLRAEVQAAIDAEIALRARQLEPVGPETTLLVDAIADLLRGGKRLRAAFCYWGYRAADGRAAEESIVKVATAMELFQAAALIHDDVMDDSDTRRGMPAAHRRLATVHADRDWDGEPDRFGLAGAILAGNLCLTWTDALFATSGLPTDELARARPIFDEMRNQLMGGQFLDVLESVRGWEDLGLVERLATSRQVIAYKSAKYSVEHPLLIGAAAAGLGATDLTELSRFGLAVGEAFQLRDDLLGVYGDPEVTGKPAGDDLREGKRTVLMAYTLDGLGEQEADRFLDRLGRPDLGPDDVAWMREQITGSGAVTAVEADIAGLVDDALAALGRTQGLVPHGRQALQELAHLATRRSS